MIVREHIKWPLGNWCRYCGAKCDMFGDFGKEATCIQREDGIVELMPEPKRRELACEDRDVISTRIKEIFDANTEALNHHE